MYYQVSKEFFDKLPNACFGAVAVRGLDNTHEIPELEQMLAENVAACETYFAGKQQSMRLTDEWFMALSENEAGQLITVQGRDELKEFMACGKLKERVEVTWPYESDSKGLPSEALAERMETVEAALRKAVEKDKLAILSGVYTGGGEKVWQY